MDEIMPGSSVGVGGVVGVAGVVGLVVGVASSSSMMLIHSFYSGRGVVSYCPQILEIEN